MQLRIISKKCDLISHKIQGALLSLMWLQIPSLMRDYVSCLGVSLEYLSIHPKLVAQDIIAQILL